MSGKKIAKKESKKETDKTSGKRKLAENTLLQDILEIKGSNKILSEFKVPCLGCPMAKMEMGFLKIGDICNTYGIDLEKLLKNLNKL